MKKCSYLKCGKEFEPNKPKQIFCSAKCRVYENRIKKHLEETSGKINKENKMSEVILTERQPEKLKGESGVEYLIRLAEWKGRQK